MPLWSVWLLCLPLSRAGGGRTGERRGGARAVSGSLACRQALCEEFEELGQDAAAGAGYGGVAGAGLLQRRSRTFALAPPPPLRGFYLTRPPNAARREAIEALVAADRAGVAVRPFVAADDPGDSHPTRVHKAHMAILSSCMKFRSDAKCLVLEDDAVWPAGRLGALVRKISREQGPRAWDLLMLGMGNGKHLSRAELVGALRPRGWRAHSVRVSATLCGCHAYVVNGRQSLQRVSGLLAHRAYRRENETEACVEGLTAEMLERFRVRVISTRHAFARQASPRGGPGVYRWSF